MTSSGFDHQTLSPDQELLLSVADQLESGRVADVVLQDGVMVLAAWLRREAYVAAGQAGQLRGQGIRIDVADAVAEDDPGFLLAKTFAQILAGQTGT